MWRSRGGPYKEHFACFACRKAYKQIARADLPEHERPAPGEPRAVPCPQCRAPMADVGPDFEAPRQSDVKRWQVAEVLHQHGIRLAGGPGPGQAALKEVQGVLEARGLASEGEKLLRNIGQRRRKPRP